jgi:hypothetical protein
MRRLDGRLPRGESRRLRRHVKDCLPCARFGRVQKQQRSLLKGLSVMPVPASIFLLRGETAAAAGGTASVAAGAGATGIATGLVAKAAAVTAAAVVAGGVGYEVAVAPSPAAKAEPQAAQRSDTPHVAGTRTVVATPLLRRAPRKRRVVTPVVETKAPTGKRVHEKVAPGQAKANENRAAGAVKTPPGQTKVKPKADAPAKTHPVTSQAGKVRPERVHPVRRSQPKKAKEPKPVREKTAATKAVKPTQPVVRDRAKPDRPVDPGAIPPEPNNPPQNGKADRA